MQRGEPLFCMHIMGDLLTPLRKNLFVLSIVINGKFFEEFILKLYRKLNCRLKYKIHPYHPRETCVAPRGGRAALQRLATV